MLLALTLLPNLQSTPNSRLVVQSSELHRSPLSSTQFASLDEINTDLGPNSTYSRSKLAQILFVRALVRRMFNNEPGFQSAKYDGPWINATHPGVVATDQHQQAQEAYGMPGKIGIAAMKPFMKGPVDQGCRSALFAATSEDVVKDKIQGQYVSPTPHHRITSNKLLLLLPLAIPTDIISNSSKIIPDRKVTDPSKQAQDEELGENLWRLSEQIITEKLGGLPYKQDL